MAGGASSQPWFCGTCIAMAERWARGRPSRSLQVLCVCVCVCVWLLVPRARYHGHVNPWTADLALLTHWFFFCVGLISLHLSFLSLLLLMTCFSLRLL